MKECVIPRLIMELLERGMRVSFCEMVDGTPTYNVDGFYKSGTVNLRSLGSDETVLCTARYDEEEEVNDFNDLLHVNLSWWRRSKERSGGWSQPDSRWLPHLLEAGLVKETLGRRYDEVQRNRPRPIRPFQVRRIGA